MERPVFGWGGFSRERVYSEETGKDLTIQDPNHVTTQAFWKTAADAQQGVNAIYSTYHRDGLSRQLYFQTMVRSDDPFIAANRRVTITLMREAPPLPIGFKP